MAIAGAKINTGYLGIDRFRIIAAAMVIAIHTSPLFSISQTTDFILVNIICRVAVPFFFIANGFFLYKSQRQKPLLSFVKKISVYYFICILFYLPLNIYAGYFKSGFSASSLIKDILWNGTFYHLWYFPAAILGAAVAFWLDKQLGLKPALIISAVLYTIGLGGDSYFGVVSAVPAINSFYNLVFNIFDYTRNGLFFAPLFVLLGFHFANNTPKQSNRFYSLGLCASFVLMLMEALLLYSFDVMRHSSMYLFLPAVMFFLFNILMQKTGAGLPVFRRASLYVYIIHPWCIVAVRGAAKLLRLEHILIETSPVFFISVCALSFALAFLAALIPPPHTGTKQKHERAWAVMDENALAHNLNEMRALLPQGAQVMAVVKADAYGHGAVWVAKAMQKQGVTAFAVATMDEGIQLRKHFIYGTILVLGYTPAACASKLRFWRLTQTAVSADHAKQLSATGVRLNIHIKADTGMHRLGISAENTNEIAEIYNLPNLKVGGIFTHLARADGNADDDLKFTKKQIQAFYALTGKLEDMGINTGNTHLQSSYGLLMHPGLHCSYARVGIALYGAHSSASVYTAAQASLKPVMSVFARVASVQTVPQGEWVGYGASHCCQKETKAAIVTFGYADGMPRAISGGRVLICGQSAPIIGRICMDALMVDVTDIPNAKEGETATIIGTDGLCTIQAEELAQNSKTITNELFTHIGSRVKKEHIRIKKTSAVHFWAKQQNTKKPLRHLI